MCVLYNYESTVIEMMSSESINAVPIDPCEPHYRPREMCWGNGYKYDLAVHMSLN